MTPEQIEQAAIERAVDVVRLALSAISRSWTDKALIHAMSRDLQQSSAGAALCHVEQREDDAWDTIRPALRKLVAEVKAQASQPAAAPGVTR